MDPSAPPDLAIRQLALPLINRPAPSAAEAVLTIAPARVWAGLSPTTREQVAQIVRRICAEVADDADRG